MSVLIDTSVWSLALRRYRRDLSADERTIVFRCRDLTISGHAQLIGPILQEALSGISDPAKIKEVKDRLIWVRELPLSKETFVLAAEFYNTCRRNGIAPQTIDMTICAAAHEHSLPIFTTDPDFFRYRKLLPISLHTPA